MSATSQTSLNLTSARKIIHAPEAFSKKAVRAAVAFVSASAEADEEDRFWADAADDI